MSIGSSAHAPIDFTLERVTWWGMSWWVEQTATFISMISNQEETKCYSEKEEPNNFTNVRWWWAKVTLFLSQVWPQRCIQLIYLQLWRKQPPENKQIHITDKHLLQIRLPWCTVFLVFVFFFHLWGHGEQRAAPHCKLPAARGLGSSTARAH